MSTAGTASTASNIPLEIKILLKEYDHRFKEVLNHLERYSKQTDLLNFFVTSVIAAVAFFFSDKGRDLLKSPESMKLIYEGSLVFGGCLVFYLFSSIINSLSMIYLNGARIGAIEQTINRALQQEILTWDSMAMPHFFQLRPVGGRLWVRPTVLAGGWIFLIFLFICAGFCYLSWQVDSLPFAMAYTPIIGALSLFHIYQWVLLNTVGKKAMYAYFKLPTTQIPDPPIQSEHLVAALPVLSVLVITVSSMRMHALGFGSRYDFPLLSVPSVWIGDLVFLPFLNYHITRWFKKFHGLRSVFVSVRSGLAMAIALPTTVYIHSMWIHDPWTGFMDDSYGRMTPAGWDHLVFSSFELWLVLLFLVHWAFPPQGRSSEQASEGRRAWRVFVMFSMLGLGDLAIKHLYILKSTGMSWLIVREALVSLVPLISGLVIYRYLGRARSDTDSPSEARQRESRRR